MQKFKALVAREPVVVISIAGLDNTRAEHALRNLPVSEIGANSFVIRDAISKDHEPFVYLTVGEVSYSHERKGDVVTFYKESYSLVVDGEISNEWITMLNVLRNIKSAANLIEHYVTHEFSDDLSDTTSFDKVLDKVESITKNADRLAELNLELQRKVQ